MSYQYAEQFRLAIANAGLTPPDDLVADGLLYRFSKDGTKWDDSGWYVFFADGLGGVFGCWSWNLNENWRADIGREWTIAELDAHRKKTEEAKRKRDAEKVRMQLEAKEQAAIIWASATPADPANFYLHSKGIQPHGVREKPDYIGEPSLRIPMFYDDELWNIQTIYKNGIKMFSKGGRVSGCYCPIGVTDGAKVVCIAEGFATAATVYEATGFPTYCAFNAGNLLHVAKSVRSMRPDARIIIAGDDDWKTEGNTGKTKATEAGIAVGVEVLFPVFGADREDGATDFNDMACATGLDSVREVFAGNPAQEEPDAKDEPQSDSSSEVGVDASSKPQKLSKAARDALLERLVGMSLLDYEQERAKLAAQMGVRASVLDAEVRKLRKEADSIGGIDFGEIEPWHEPVDFAELLDCISVTIRRFIVCEKGTADAAALWVVMTWVVDIIPVAPLAVITAPEKRCGKTELLTLLGRMVFRPLGTSNITPSALFRVIEMCSPTLMIDEVDAFMRENEEARGIINSGYKREIAFVIRNVGDTHVPTKFSTWGAKALCGIGKLADTIMDRAIILQLRRKLPHESVERLRYAEPELFSDIASKIKRCVDDSRDDIRMCRPDLPSRLNDRQQECWEPLLAIADVAGGGWSERARDAALNLSGESESVKTLGNELLSDIHDILTGKNLIKISTADLIKALCADDEKPWSTFNRGREMTPRQLSARLGEYCICSKNIKIGLSSVVKGFQADQFKDAFARYLFAESGDAAEEKVACSGYGDVVADTNFVSATSETATSKESSGVADSEEVAKSEKVVVSI